MTEFGQPQVPRDSMSAVREVLVPINGSSVSLAALNLATKIAQVNKGRVFAIYVIEVARNLPLEAELPEEIERSERVFAEAEKVIHDRQSLVEFAVLQARTAAATIVDEAVNINAEAIILGVTSKPRSGDVALGQTAEFILKHAPCQVWLCRAAQSERS